MEDVKTVTKKSDVPKVPEEKLPEEKLPVEMLPDEKFREIEKTCEELQKENTLFLNEVNELKRLFITEAMKYVDCLQSKQDRIMYGRLIEEYAENAVKKFMEEI